MFYINMRLSNSLIVLIIALSSSMFAQVVNVENKRNYDDTAGVSGGIDASFTALKTKDLIVNFFLRPRVQYKTQKNYFLLLSDVVYSKGGTNVFSNLGMFHFRYAYRIKGGLKWENYYQIQYNQLLSQRSRMLLGSGLRQKCFDKKGYKFFIGSSVFIEREESIAAIPIEYGVRSSNYLSWYFDPKSHFFFSGVVYVQPLFSDFNDIRILGQYALNFKFTKRTDFKIEFSHLFDSNPFIGVVRFTFNSSFGIRFKFGE